MKNFDKERIKEIFKIISFKKHEKIQKSQLNINQAFIYLGLILIMLAFCIGFIFNFLHKTEILKISMYILIISAQIAIILGQLLTLFYESKELKKLFENPQLEIIKPLEYEVDNHVSVIDQLNAYSEIELKYVEERLQSKLESLDKRIGLLIGQIDKVGLFPTILALLILIYKPDLLELSEQNWILHIIWLVVLIVIVFNILGFYMNEQTEYLRLKIKIIKFTINAKTNFKND